MEQSLVLVKPDGMMKKLIGNIVADLSQTDLNLVGSKVVQVTRELAEEHYQHLKDKEFFDELIQFIMGDLHVKRVLALVYQGEDACKKIRAVVGSTNPEEAEPHTIRGRYGRITTKGMFETVVHASENPSEAEREIKLWFRPNELIETIYPFESKKSERTEFFWK